MKLILRPLSAAIKLAPRWLVRFVSRTVYAMPGLRRYAYSIADRGSTEGLGEVVIKSSPRLTLGPDGSSISKFCYFLGENRYEPGEAKIWEKLCQDSNSILELGGNVGFFTVLGAASKPNADYHVIEPHPLSAASLRDNIERNSLKNVRISQSAVVGNPETQRVHLHIPGQETGRQSTGAYIDGAEGIDRPGDEVFEVSTVLASDVAKGIDLLKLDVEGAEAEILSSMDSALSEARPIILVEVRRRTPKLRNWIKQFSESNGYELWSVSNTPKQIPLPQIETVVLQEEYSTRDILIVPTERKEVARRALLAS